MKLKNLENVKSNLSRCHYPDPLIKQGFQKALPIPQKDLRKPKKPSNENVLPFITTFNPDNPNICSTIRSSVNCLKNKSVSGFHNIKLIQSKRQSPNLKKLLTKLEYGEVLSGTFICRNDHYTFKNVPITFKLKTALHAIVVTSYVIICDTCKEEYIGETGERKAKLRDRVYHQHIRQPQYQQLKVEGHLRLCGNGEFRIFPLL